MIVSTKVWDVHRETPGLQGGTLFVLFVSEKHTAAFHNYPRMLMELNVLKCVIFKVRNIDILFISAQNIDCVNSL